MDQAESLGINAIVDSPGSGSGLSTYDFNEDGLDDITLTNSFGDILCYQNTGDGFELMDFGLSVPGLGSMMAWVDYDNDNDLDVLIASYQGQIILYKNNGDFIFEEYSAEAGLPSISTTYYGFSLADYDLDGDLDLYTGVYASDLSNPYATEEINRLYRNNGDGSFTDVTVNSQIIAPATLTFMPAWFDFNIDGYPDLYVINDRFPQNYMFQNNGDGTFTEKAFDYGVDYPDQDVMSNSISDLDQDGDLDIFMTNSGNPIEELRNLLAVNQNGNFFTEEAATYGIDDLVPGWGGVWFDWDGDSSQDLLYVTEHDYPIFLYKNLNGSQFEPMLDSISVQSNHTAYSAAKGDFNGDGFTDIAVQGRFPNPGYVLINEANANNFIKITPKGTISNKQAIGSWVKAYTDGEERVQYTHCGDNYLSQSSQHLVFGLGSAIQADSVKITYPSMHTDVYYNITADSSLIATEGETYSVDIEHPIELNICAGDSILLDAGAHASILWSNGDTTQTIWVNQGGMVSITTWNEFGISASDSVEISMSEAPLISPIITPPSCFGDSTGNVILENQLEIELDSIFWNNMPTENPIEGLASGTYDFVCTDINGCITEGSVTLIDPTELFVIGTCTPEIGDSLNGTIAITIFGGTPPYELSLNGVDINSPIENLEAGWYEFVVIDSNGCESYFQIEVEQVLNIGVAGSNEVKLYPNPFMDELYIQSETRIENVILYSSCGSSVLKIEQNNPTILDIEKYSSGIYVLQIVFQDGTTSFKKIIKE